MKSYQAKYFTVFNRVKREGYVTFSCASEDEDQMDLAAKEAASKLLGVPMSEIKILSFD
nr:hypothetical protein [Brevibacillus laterosporus]